MKKLITKIVIASFALALLVSCGTGGLDGTYVACNDAAKQMQFAKFVFNDEEVGFLDKVFQKNTVKVYKGMYGVVIPSAEEYTYSLKGKRLIIEGGIPGVNGQSIELTYNKELDQISLNMDYAFDMLGGIAQQIGDHYDQLEEINAQLGHRKEKKANVNANEVSQGLKQLAGDVTPIWGREGVDCISPNQKEKDDEASENVANCKNKFWKNSPQYFCQTLAERCAEYSYAVYYSDNEKIGDNCPVYKDKKSKYSDGSIEKLLTGDKYDSIKYYPNYSEDGIGFALAHKEEVDGEIILAVVIRGTCNGCFADEWKGNMNIWEKKDKPEPKGRHYSFQNANSELLQKTINAYIIANDLKDKGVKLLITGHSRGAGVGNLLATDCIEKPSWCKANIQSVYAYFFATPNCIEKLKQKQNTSNVGIFNFCFNDDFVTQVPLSAWGYGKSGKTYTAVAQGLIVTNPDFKDYGKNLVFNSSAVTNVIKDVCKLASSVDTYYNTKLKMASLYSNLLAMAYDVWQINHCPFCPTWDPEEKKTLHEFMKDYVAQATIDNDEYNFSKNLEKIGLDDILTVYKLLQSSSALTGLFTKYLCETGNDVHNIAYFFIDGAFKGNIENTHDMPTYQAALENNGFGTLYLYRNQN